MMQAMLQVMVDVPAELHKSLLPKQQQQETPSGLTLAGLSGASKGAAGQQNAAVVDLTDSLKPTAKRRRA